MVESTRVCDSEHATAVKNKDEKYRRLTARMVPGQRPQSKTPRVAAGALKPRDEDQRKQLRVMALRSGVPSSAMAFVSSARSRSSARHTPSCPA